MIYQTNKQMRIITFHRRRKKKAAPNVDFVVKIPCENDIKIGEFYDIKLTNFENYYFIGELV